MPLGAQFAIRAAIDNDRAVIGLAQNQRTLRFHRFGFIKLSNSPALLLRLSRFFR